MIARGSLRRPRTRDGLVRDGLVRVGLVVAVVLGVLLWWWWPGLTGDPDDIDVGLVIGDELTVADQSIDRRLREEGFLLERAASPADWCEVDDLVAEVRGPRVVVWAASSAACRLDTAVDDLVRAAAGRRVVVVRLPTDDPAVRDAFESRGITVVDTERLLGQPGAVRECLWWEECPASGVVEPWDGDRLGAIGGERVARMIVTQVL